MSTIAKYVVLSQSENAAQQIWPSPRFTGVVPNAPKLLIERSRAPTARPSIHHQEILLSSLFQLLQVQLDSFRRRL
jgi:hypothetical protein